MDYESGLAQAIDKIVEINEAGTVHEHPDGHSKVIVLPSGWSTKTLSEDRVAEFISASPTLKDVASFTSYVNQFKGPATQIFADPSQNVMTAVLDYHEPNKAARAAHMAVLSLQYAPEWLAWTGISGKETPQKPFAEFVEENQLFILEPDGATVLEMVRNLKVDMKVEFASKVDLKSGRIQLTYNEIEDAQTSAKGQVLTLPDHFELALGVYDGEPRTDKVDGHPIRVLIRTRFPEKTKLAFIAKLMDQPAIKKAAFSAVCQRVANDTGIKVLWGSPSATGR